MRIHLNSLRNWQLGLIEAIKMYGLTLKKRIEKLNQQWNREFKSKSTFYYSIKQWFSNFFALFPPSQDSLTQIIDL